MVNMKSLNEMGLQIMFNELIRESAKNNSLEFNEYVYQVLDDYKTSYEMQEGSDLVRHTYIKLSDLF
jgi:hypothetical protein